MSDAINCIHPQAQLHKDVRVGPFTVIERDVVIGEGTWVGPHVTIMSGVRIGRHCQIFPGAVIGGIPQDLKFRGEATYVRIGDHTTIREGVTINRGTSASYQTTVGDQVLLMAYVHVAHDCKIGPGCILANAVQLAGHVEVGAHAQLGGKAVVRQFVKIGAYAMVGGGSLVRKDVPPFIKVAREPIRYCGVNVIGLRRRGLTAEQIQTIQTIYRYIFQKGLPLHEALARIQAEIAPLPIVDTVLNFIREATLGIVKKPALTSDKFSYLSRF
ncbi:MAG: acyl-ACP--UDP-N-acetylglucosamine O-acyltransferase [Bacteroidota bacterium]